MDYSECQGADGTSTVSTRSKSRVDREQGTEGPNPRPRPQPKAEAEDHGLPRPKVEPEDHGRPRAYAWGTLGALGWSL